MTVDITRYLFRWIFHFILYSEFALIAIRAVIYGDEIYERY